MSVHGIQVFTTIETRRREVAARRCWGAALVHSGVREMERETERKRGHRESVERGRV